MSHKISSTTEHHCSIPNKLKTKKDKAEENSKHCFSWESINGCRVCVFIGDGEGMYKMRW